MLRFPLLVVFVLAGSAAWAADWSDADKERFLRTARVAAIEPAPAGVTGSRRAEFVSSDGLRHDAHIQTVDQAGDYYGFNIAAYRLDRLLGTGLAPVSVLREVSGEPAAVTWWVDDFLMLEADRWKARRQPPDVSAWNRRMLTARVFNELIYNTDANLGNIVIDRNWKTWLIDFTRSFRAVSRLRAPQQLSRIDGDLLRRLRALTKVELEESMGDLLTEERLAALIARRDSIVARFDELIAEKGEAAVLFDGS